VKIGIILHPYDEDKPAGLARTIFEWTKGLLILDSENEYIVFVKKTPRKAPDLPGKNWRLESLGGGMFWLDKLKKAEKCDVYIFNTPVVPLFYKPKRSIVLALDYAYFYLKGENFKNFVSKWFTYVIHFISLRKCDEVIAISEATKEDTIKLFKISEKKIKVIYLGYKKICSVPEIEVPLPKKFFFFAGIIKERKNVKNIVKAFHKFSSSDSNIDLAIAGNPSGAYFEEIEKYIEDNNLLDRVKFLGHMNDGQLSYIYKKSFAFVFPTLIEGFGMPVAEAMDCGVPVITSNQSSLKEVGGNNSSILVDPYNPEDISKAMERLASDGELREALIKKGKEQSKLFSWEISARKLFEVIKKITD
tara:strand:- start:2303 stop:3385 length:1083 start_codon:yes stop_codon:yes gene_type:complete